MINNKFKTLFELRNYNIKSVKALLCILNKVYNCFGFEIRRFQEGCFNNRKYIYKFIRLNILENYLERIDNNVEIIDM